MSGAIDAAELERRVHAYLPKIKRKRTKSRFMRFAVALATEGEVHGLRNLARLAGHEWNEQTGWHLAHALLEHLIAARVAADKPEKESCYVEKIDCRISDVRLVIRLHEDLMGTPEEHADA